MIETQTVCSPFVLASRDGSRHTFRTRASVVRSLGRQFLETQIGEEFTADQVKVWSVGADDPWREVVRRGVEYMLTDARGRVLTALDFADLFPARRPWWASRFRFYSGSGPVPGTSKSRGGHHTWRHPKTMQERRDAVFADPDEALAPPRPRRTGTHLPTAILAAAGRDRSWKRHRKTQWR